MKQTNQMICRGCGKTRNIFFVYCAECILRDNYKDDDWIDFKESEEWFCEVIEQSLTDCEELDGQS